MEVKLHAIAVSTDDGINEKRIDVLWIVRCDLQALKPLEAEDA
jgi:hypothetical protein